MKREEKLDSSQYCPDSCESLYKGKCIMKIDGNYNGAEVWNGHLFFEQLKLRRRYFRREDCQLREKSEQ